MQRHVEDLEIKVAFLEKHLLDLDAVVRELADTISVLQADIIELRETATTDGDAQPSTLEDEVPPHY
jgi:uncharacterized coiled-coil protein SlyX